MITWQHRLGYYQVGNKLILNKANALLEAQASNVKARWVFNDNVYGRYDWTVPIETPLKELYRRRAQQIRDQYDYLMLYYSGGADSTNALHAFIDNNIFLDEIVMQHPTLNDNELNNYDTDNNNYFSELKYAAMPHLDKVKHLLHPDTKIKFLNQTIDTVSIFSDQYWFEKYPLGTMITPAGAGRQISAILDPDLDGLYEAGKTVCQIYGVDKPLVFVEGEDDYFAVFRDSNATHAVPTDFELGELASKYFHLEFFYWTPDMPEIVIKQAQEIKKAAQADAAIKKCLHLSARVEDFRRLVHPVIYLPEACGDVFQTDKPTGAVYRPMDKWFWRPEFKKAQDNYLQVIEYLKTRIDSEHALGNNIYNGLKSILSRRYPL